MVCLSVCLTLNAVRIRAFLVSYCRVRTKTMKCGKLFGGNGQLKGVEEEKTMQKSTIVRTVRCVSVAVWLRVEKEKLKTKENYDGSILGGYGTTLPNHS